MSTLLLTRTDVQHSMQALTLLEEMREAFRVQAAASGAESQAAVPQRLSTSPQPGLQARVSLPGLLRGIDAYTVAVRTSGAGGPVRGFVHLQALDSGAPLAVLEASHLTALATGVVGAVAADVLARAESSRVALLGAGPQASRQLKSLRLVRSLQHARVYDADMARAVEFAARTYKELNLPVRPALSVEEAVEDADVVLVTGSPGAPVLFPGMLRPGTHVTALATEGLGVCGLAPGFLRQSSFFCDFAAGAGLPGEDLQPTDLGEVLAGQRPGRSDAGQISVFALLAPPWQDLVAAWHVYQGVRGDEDARRLDFES